MEESCLCGHRSPTRAEGQQRGSEESKQAAGTSHTIKEEEKKEEKIKGNVEEAD